MVIDLRTALSQLPLPSTPFWDKTMIEHGTMSVIVFTPRGHDYQTKHRQDELYIVIKGTLMIADAPRPFREGDALFVPAETQRRFVNFTDFVTWAIFWGPQGGER
jgi:mannose-6-phosphate isomerase-like protein (cupin superfamily)